MIEDNAVCTYVCYTHTAVYHVHSAIHIVLTTTFDLKKIGQIMSRQSPCPFTASIVILSRLTFDKFTRRTCHFSGRITRAAKALLPVI